MMFSPQKIDNPTRAGFPKLVDRREANRLVNDELSYLTFFGLRINPFPVAPDDENFYFSEHIDQIVTELVHGIVTRKGFMVLTGDIGLGKTTISRWIMNILEEKRVETALVFHTTFQDVELLAEINRDFGIKADGPTFSDQMWALNQFLLDQNRSGRNCAIIIDDAQNLNRRSLELIRMISNLEAYHEKLVQILLVGQPELMEKLNTRELRQLKSRIIINKEVHPLKSREVKNYIQFKLNTAGNKGLLSVSGRALRKLYQFTRGNFRQLNTLMDRCLYAAFLNSTKEIDGLIVKTAQADLHPARPEQGHRRRLWAVTVVVLAVIAIAIGFYVFGPYGYRSTHQMPPAANRGNTAGHDASGAISLSAPVDNFLSAYGLAPYAASFSQALKSQQWHAVTATIYDQTGYFLIRMTRLPDHIRQQYDVFSYPAGPAGEGTYYLFWKPKVSFAKFYYRLEGEHVHILQEMLAAIDLYHDKLDGIVGKNLMQAIIQFQKQTDLTVTGYPDQTTLFLLAHHERRIS